MYQLLFTWTSDSFSCSVYKFHQQAVDALTESLAPLFSFWASKLELCASLSHLDNCNKTKIKYFSKCRTSLLGGRLYCNINLSHKRTTIKLVNMGMARILMQQILVSVYLLLVLREQAVQIWLTQQTLSFYCDSLHTMCRLLVQRPLTVIKEKDTLYSNCLNFSPFKKWKIADIVLMHYFLKSLNDNFY